MQRSEIQTTEKIVCLFKHKMNGRVHQNPNCLKWSSCAYCGNRTGECLTLSSETDKVRTKVKWSQYSISEANDA